TPMIRRMRTHLGWRQNSVQRPEFRPTPLSDHGPIMLNRGCMGRGGSSGPPRHLVAGAPRPAPLNRPARLADGQHLVDIGGRMALGQLLVFRPAGGVDAAAALDRLA